MKRLIGWSVLCVVLAGLTGLPWLMLDDAPAIEPPGEFRRNDLAWIKTLFQKHDPRRQTPDVIQSIQLDEAELNRLLNYAVELRRVSGIAAELTPGLATVTATDCKELVCRKLSNEFAITDFVLHRRDDAQPFLQHVKSSIVETVRQFG